MVLDLENIINFLLDPRIGFPLFFFILLFIILNKDFFKAVSRFKDKKPEAHDFLMIAIFAAPIILTIGFDVCANYVTGLLASIVGILYAFFLDRKSKESEEKDD